MNHINISIDDKNNYQGIKNKTLLNSLQQNDQVNNRKMSLAAKAGQMQIFSGVHPSQSNMELKKNQNYMSQNSFMDMIMNKQRPANQMAP